MTSKEYIDAAIESWRKVSERQDLIGKQVVLANGRDSYLAKGTIRRISVEGDRFVIESNEIEAEYKAGRQSTPTISFKIDEERDISQNGNTLFCDLDDDRRQIRISTTA